MIEWPIISFVKGTEVNEENESTSKSILFMDLKETH